MGADRRRLALAMSLLGTILVATTPIMAAGGHLTWPGSWRLESPLGAVSGPFLLVEDRESWRCEIAVAENGRWPTHDDLLHRLGRGWTLTGTAGGGFVQAWDEPWRELGPAAVRSFGDLVFIMVTSDTGSAGGVEYARRRWRPQVHRHLGPVVLADWAGLPAAWRPPSDGPAGGGDLRRRLVARGRGHGGEGMVLDLRWEDGSLIGTSARWPGRIIMSPGAPDSVAVPTEAFLPLWPLAEFLP